MECSCRSLINPIKELQQAESNVLLTRVPHERTHDPVTIIKKMLEATMIDIKSRALKNTVPPIAHMHAWAEKADADDLVHQGRPCAASCPSQRVTRKNQVGNKTSSACICHLWATESMALAPDQCVQTSNDTCTT